MNYDDLLWKCKDVLSSKDYMRLCGLVVREKQLSEQVNKMKQNLGKYTDIISDGGIDPRQRNR